ncbi:hypothetical protein N7462_008017 [Penicillium macrosclerotiorum]|uniref:uncharacterized protein n=1 Tax=Penicillium macrosclerotiorum TaxID=303699 RepID=UPI00254991D8|nr:uncharacterized protein N7462_008017 [Penicillium macrosclerotiorum]KAJ5679773.1 hypothetical protein N7462_008017 [Penicillium macrosclerotiorum]
MPPQPPIFLLKTKSSPHDGYEDYFSANYTPTFIPVLEHRFHNENLSTVRELFASGSFTPSASPEHIARDPNGAPKKYGGLIFTSQRAVEAFAAMIDSHGRTSTQTSNNLISQSHPPPPIPSIPLYTVGPATARSLTTLRDTHFPTATIHGADSGNGAHLAEFILQHYNALHAASPTKPALLFLVGETRRDIIPKTLSDPARAPSERVTVDELVVYETGAVPSFEGAFARAVQECTGVLWVVVFSPTGCEAVVRVLGRGSFARERREGEGGKEENEEEAKREVLIATIGPTTRDYLRAEFGVEADVCAEKPSPEGVGEGIRRFMEGRTGGV